MNNNNNGRGVKPFFLILFCIINLGCFEQALAEQNTGTTATTSATQYDQYIEYPKIDYGTGPRAQQIQHGEYLAKAGDCIACHTVEGGLPFAGGLPIKTPFGTIYGPNITPDKETGIGKWTNEQFVRALREGKNSHGQYLFPVFPYVNFNRVSNQDALDIKAYLDALPPVHQVNRKPDMAWPFNVRLLQTFWRLLFFDFQKGEFKPDTTRSPKWNRGAYLVQGLGHCSLCHTPLNFLGAPQNKYFLTGGFVDNFHAPNITSASLKDIPNEKIINVFLKDILVRGGQVQGPMLQVNHDSLRYLSHDDLDSISTYLKTVKSATPPAPTATGADAGKKIYDTYCASCHAQGSGGAPKFGEAADWSPRLAQGLDNLYKNAIKGIGGMPPRGNCLSCSDKQMQQAVDYILTNSKTKEGEAVAAKPVVSATSLQRGAEVYKKVCSICHAQGQLGAPKLGDQTVWTSLVRENEMDGLFEHAINGYKGHPKMGACYQCSDADVIAATKFMVETSVPTGNFILW